MVNKSHACIVRKLLKRRSVLPGRDTMVVVDDAPWNNVGVQVGHLVPEHRNIDAFHVAGFTQHQRCLLKVRDESTHQIGVGFVKVLDMLVEAHYQSAGKAGIVVEADTGDLQRRDGQP
ncbi:hypothetical protein BKG80_14995 [Mycobacteroides chelonae]|nr:hypothetical protein AOT84_18200 [Mycobacteroides sp. H002]KRQ52586.1 hypothetical protein AOT85_08820 [Mycobacteroides sp. H054]OHU37469.1 hypothetical protein BKG80_14995 [Mycobacteroides chelonae]OLT70839.1 hypothetical protein BKG57_24220 [Mycobacteroides chelonae]